MPSSVGGQAAARMRKMAFEINAAGRKAVQRAALDAKKVIVDEANRAAGGGRLRNVGRSGAKLGVRFDVKGTDNPTALIRATGPWQLVERPIKPHRIAPRRRRGKRAVSTPDGPRASVQHPGVRSPKRPWAKGIERAAPLIRGAVRGAYSDAFKRGAQK